MSGAELINFVDGEQIAPMGEVTIKNSGQTPARDVVNVSGIAVGLFPPPPTPKLTVTDHDFTTVARSRQTLGAANTSISRTAAGRPLEAEEKMGITEGKGAIYVYGEVRYRDVFGKDSGSSIGS